MSETSATESAVKHGSSNDSQSSQDAYKRQVYFPNLKWIAIWGFLIAGVLFLHIASDAIENALPIIDQAARNLITIMVCVFVLPLSVMFWFSFFSSWRTPMFRRLAIVGVVGAQFLAAAAIGNCVEFDGNMYPIGFHWPFSKADDYAIAEVKVETAEIKIDLKTKTRSDFPQFLGPNRDGRLITTFLENDWEKNPPKLLWKKTIGPAHSGFATTNGYAVTMEQRGDAELTTCYEIESGDLKWSHRETTRHDSWLGKLGPRSTPTIFDGRVYSLGGNGTLACLDGSNGELVWKKELFEEFGTSAEQEKSTVTWGRSASPLVFDNKVVVPAGGPKSAPVSLVAYDRKTGDELWRAGDTQISYASPVLAPYIKAGKPAQMIISVNESNITSHDIENGEEIWRHDWPGDSTANASTSQPVIIPNQRLLFTKGYGQGAQMVHFPSEQLELMWSSNRVLKTKFTNAVYFKGYVFALSDGRLECVDIRTGKSIWKSRRSYGHGQLILCGGELLVLSERGKVELVRAWGVSEDPAEKTGFVPVTSFQAIEGITWNTIAMHGDMLLVRNSNEAACYKMPIREMPSKP